MYIEKEKIESFQKIYKKKFGKKITKENAYEQAIKLLRLVELIYRPITEKEYMLLQKRRQETD